MTHAPVRPVDVPRLAARLALAATLALPLLLGATAARAAQDCELNGQPINPANGGETARKTGVLRCKDRGSGQLLREEQIQNGVFMGLVRVYENGRLAKEHTLNAKGNMHGLAREFAPGGQVLREATYDDGQERGLVRSFYPGGKLRRASFYPDQGGDRASAEFTERGQLSALRCGNAPMLAPAADDARLCGFGGAPSQVELFDARGILRSRQSYLAGKRVRTQDFYDNGKPSQLDEINGNQRTERQFSSEGVKRRETVSLLGAARSAIRLRDQEFSERGTLVRDQRWNSAGEPIGDDSYYLNGQPHTKSVYSGAGNARTVLVTEFHDNGQRAALGRYLVGGRGARQLPQGTHQRFDEKGTLVAESSFDARGRVTRERSWDENGELVRDDEVFEDGSRRAYAR
ncbi:toxin-antitoxin system YwqK family antitoxin [Variovorax sp. DAIF25]|uniref:toxin-antitoxin system YwqK family antitoxin n=1 Tax=Variovorax sp. DAIF25 TaxID=3080983 RepID=UPI003D6A233F